MLAVMMLGSSISILVTGCIWFWNGWEQGLRAAMASAIVRALIFLHLIYLVSRENGGVEGRRPKVPRRPF